jgi:hypothetical protein
MTAFGLLPAKTVAACGSTAALANDPTYRFPLIVETLARLRSELAFLIKSRWRAARRHWK